MGLTGVVLAGGDSRRFGSDKLEFPVDGRPMLGRVVEVMRTVAETVVVSVRDGATAQRLAPTVPAGVTWLEDRPDLGWAGPGAGMVTALGQLSTEEILFVPGDMPWLTAEGLRALRREGKTAGATAAAPLWPDGRPEPLVQWQRVAPWRGKLGTLPPRGGRGVRPTDLLRGGSAVLLAPVGSLSLDPRCFVNVNAVDDLQEPPDGRLDPGARALLRSEEAGAAFWAAVAFADAGMMREAAGWFLAEADLHHQVGLAHLEIHALEDAIARTQDAGRDAVDLGRRLAALRQEMDGATESTEKLDDRAGASAPASEPGRPGGPSTQPPRERTARTGGSAAPGR